MLRRLTGVAGALLIGSAAALAQPRVWIADQGENNGVNNRILEIHPYNHGSFEGSDVQVVNLVPSPAGAFLDELTFDASDRLWCVVKDAYDPGSGQHPDGCRLIDKDDGTIFDPPGTIHPPFPGEVFEGHLEGLAFDGVGLWVTAVRDQQLPYNMLTRVDPATGNPIAPFDSGPLAARGFVNVPGTVAQGLLWEPGNGGYGWLWHSEVFEQKIYKLDVSRLFTDPEHYDPYHPGAMTVASFSVPFKPKGMDWMGAKIWVTAPFGSYWNPSGIAGIYEFDPATGDTQKLFSTPSWNLDGLAILAEPPGPRIDLSTDAIAASIWIGTGDPPDDEFTVRNGREGTLNYKVEEAEGWLAVTPENGSSVGEPDPITVSFNVAGLDPGEYHATINVTGNAYNSPQTIAVTLVVETARPDLDRDRDVDQEDYGELQRCYGGSGIAPSPGCEDADFDGDNDVDGADFDVFVACHSGADVPATPGCHD